MRGNPVKDGEQRKGSTKWNIQLCRLKSVQ